MEYQVFLTAKSLPSNVLPANFTLSYSELYLAVKLNTANSNISSINEAQTETCLNPVLSDFANDFEADATEELVTLRLSSLLGENPPGIPFTNYMTTNPLFSVIVDAFPGEIFQLECNLLTYVSDGNCNDQYSCVAPNAITFPSPNQINTDLTVSLGQIDCNNEEYIEVPVAITHSLVFTTIISLDFAIDMSNTAGDMNNEKPQIIDQFPVTTTLIDGPIDKDYGDFGYTYHVTYKGVSAINLPSGTTVFKLRIPRPMNLCQGYTSDVVIRPGRLITLGANQLQICKSVDVGDATVSCSTPFVPVCGTPFQFVVLPEGSTADCKTSKIIAELRWPTQTMGSSIDLTILKTKLEFGLANGVEITNAYLENFSCPAVNSPTQCPGNCLQWDTKSVDLCISTTDGNAVNVQYPARIVIEVSTAKGCIIQANIRKTVVKQKGNSEPICQPDIEPTAQFPFCPPMIQGEIATELNCYLEGLNVNYTASTNPDCSRSAIVSFANPTDCGPYSTCLCEGYAYTVTPMYDENPLNGVSTFDLVLISRHILGLETLNSPYKLIAADANKSKSITPFDIVELRKLILGVYQQLPANTSWRFVDKDYVFPDPANPFQATFPEYITVPSIPATHVDFTAIKVGDVNNTNSPSNCTMCNAFTTNKPSGRVSFGVVRDAGQRGSAMSVPIIYNGSTPAVACQMALRFDPNVLELIGPAEGDAMNVSVDNFGLTETAQGLLKFSWIGRLDLEEEGMLQPGQTLFYLNFKVKKEISADQALLSTDDEALSGLTWLPQGASYTIDLTDLPATDRLASPTTTATVSSALCLPNPSSESFVLQMHLKKASQLRFAFYDAFGTRVWFRDLKLSEGTQTLAVSEAAAWPAGMYHWEIREGRDRIKGAVIKL